MRLLIDAAAVGDHRVFEALSADPLFVHLAGGVVPSLDTIYRAERRFDEAALGALEKTMATHGLAPVRAKRRSLVHLDIDTAVEPTFGEHEGALPGPNPCYHGRPSYHPILARCAETDTVVGGKLRPGHLLRRRRRAHSRRLDRSPAGGHRREDGDSRPHRRGMRAVRRSERSGSYVAVDAVPLSYKIPLEVLSSSPPFSSRACMRPSTGLIGRDEGKQSNRNYRRTEKVAMNRTTFHRALPIVLLLTGCPTRTVYYSDGGFDGAAGASTAGGAGGAAGSGGRLTGAGGAAAISGMSGAEGNGTGGGAGHVAGTGGSGTGGTLATTGGGGDGGAAAIGGAGRSGQGAGGTGDSGGTGHGGLGGTAGAKGTGGAGGSGMASNGSGGGLGGNGVSQCSWMNLAGACGTICEPGVYSCTASGQVCVQKNAVAGTDCGTNQICDGSGNCVAKTADGGSCQTNATCQGGHCVADSVSGAGLCCPTSESNCGSCVDEMKDTSNCGGCSVTCKPRQLCNSGLCQCSLGGLNCGGCTGWTFESSAEMWTKDSDPNGVYQTGGNGASAPTWATDVVCPTGLCPGSTHSLKTAIVMDNVTVYSAGVATALCPSGTLDPYLHAIKLWVYFTAPFGSLSVLRAHAWNSASVVTCDLMWGDTINSTSVNAWHRASCSFTDSIPADHIAIWLGNSGAAWSGSMYLDNIELD